MIRFYEDLKTIQENRLSPRAYYIPENSKTSLDGEWDFKYFERDLDAFLRGAEPTFDSSGGDFEEFCMLRLRLADGLKSIDTQRLFGFNIPQSVMKKARALEKHSLTVCTEDSIRLTKQGFLLSNAVITEILS